MSSRYYAMIRQDWRDALWIPFMRGVDLSILGAGARYTNW